MRARQPVAMDPTVLQVTCGSCGNQVNVPASLLDGLLRARKFSCPHCGSSQQVRTVAALCVGRGSRSEPDSRLLLAAVENGIVMHGAASPCRSSCLQTRSSRFGSSALAGLLPSQPRLHSTRDGGMPPCALPPVTR